jgi:hypothetical protein
MKKILCLFAIALAVISCNEKDAPFEPPPLRGTARINGSFTTFTATELRVFLVNNFLRNKVILSRDNGFKIEIDFWGNSKGIYGPFLNDTLPRARFFDGSGRIYEATTGFVNISNYRSSEGEYDLSGTFEFNAEFELNDTTILPVVIRDGGFANVKNVQ